MNSPRGAGEKGREGEKEKRVPSILDHIVLDHVKGLHATERIMEKHLRQFYRTTRDTENYFSPVSVINLDTYDIRFHRRGVFTAMFIVGPLNHKGG